MATEKFTFKQFQAQYADDDACLRAIFNRKYGETKHCPSCGVESKLVKIEGRRAYACQEGCHIYPCAGTIFEKSRTKLTLWFHAMYLMTATRNGVSAGIALYNYLRALPVEILTYNIGMVASIANVIFMAAESQNRFACPHTSFLFHGVNMHLGAPMQLDLSQVKEFESNMSRDLERIAEVFIANTSLKKEKIDALFQQGEIQNLSSAVTDGIIAEVKALKIPAGAVQLAFALNLGYVRAN